MQPHWRPTPGTDEPDVVDTGFSREGTRGAGPENIGLMQAVESHGGFVVKGDEPPRPLADKGSRVATLRQSGGFKLAESRDESLTSNLENLFLQNYEAAALDRSTNGT